MKQDETTLSDSRRTAFEKMLATNYGNPVWERARDKYETVRRSRKQELIRSSLPVEAKKLAGEIESLRAELEPLEEKLWAAGFQLDNDHSIEILHSAKKFGQGIEKRLNQELGTSEKTVTKPFENARAQILFVATAEEARKIVEPLLHFEVKLS
ncbi:MAG TPA: hypothetical protein VGP62_13230 [Bryobacteraceae bacterium]|jgi:hypothetical protein|nr:hypothetical protein [Bryobacteraceae bacterium]